MVFFKMTKMKPKGIVILFILLTAFITTFLSAGMRVQAGIRVDITADKPKIGSEMEVEAIILRHGWKIPLILTQTFPTSSEVISVEPPGEIKTTDDGTTVTWKNMLPTEEEWKSKVRFRLTERGYYKIKTEAVIGHFTEDEMRKAKIALKHGNPNADRDLADANLIAITTKNYRIRHDTYYIKVTKRNGRIETWNFRNFWNKIKHALNQGEW